jgi:hypothetical protein
MIVKKIMDEINEYISDLENVYEADKKKDGENATSTLCTAAMINAVKVVKREIIEKWAKIEKSGEIAYKAADERFPDERPTRPKSDILLKGEKKK